jgi:Na+-translocating ferredoxin:NAD+ oxidoreductase RnfA subunit
MFVRYVTMSLSYCQEDGTAFIKFIGTCDFQFVSSFSNHTISLGVSTIYDLCHSSFIYITYFFYNCAIYEIMLKNMVEPEVPQMMLQYGAYKLHVG